MRLTLYFDGACFPNPGEMGIGAYLEGAEGPVQEISEKLPGKGTNNVAEYTALIRGLEAAHKLGCDEIVIRGDSNLVINQALGKFRVREPHLRPLLARVVELAEKFKRLDVQWIPREKNKQADELSSRAISYADRAGAKPGSPALGSKPSAREHSILCPKCNKPMALSLQRFADGSDHVRQACAEHGFQGYAPNVEPFLSLARKGPQG